MVADCENLLECALIFNAANLTTCLALVGSDRSSFGAAATWRNILSTTLDLMVPPAGYKAVQ